MLERDKNFIVEGTETIGVFFGTKDQPKAEALAQQAVNMFNEFLNLKEVFEEFNTYLEDQSAPYDMNIMKRMDALYEIIQKME
jgi:hypothetical protein